MFHFHRWKINRLLKKVKAMQATRAHAQPADALLKKEIGCYFELAGLYKKVIGCKKYPYAELKYIECLRQAATLDDALAHYQLGQLFMDEARYRLQIFNEGIFNSMENQMLAKQRFEEAHVHLMAADKLGNIAAKRLRGLSIINGWGVDANKDAGFELIVSSIEQEGSWDKVPQIFAGMGLNKPEFFAAIMQRRKG